jgi:hypothetical protein
MLRIILGYGACFVNAKPYLTWYEPELEVYFSRGMSLEG